MIDERSPRVNYTRGTIAMLAVLIPAPVLLARGPDHLILAPDLLVQLAGYAMLRARLTCLVLAHAQAD
jgi:hypothetical protein